MPCYHPITAYRSKEGKNQRGKIPLVFSENKGEGLSLKIPCGRCIGCRLERSRQWAIRCMHEASLHEDNYFITLTYDDENLERKCGIYDEEIKCVRQYSLNKREFQLFVKRLRKEFGNGIKYYHCGEYGGKTGRPHHHACMFGLKIKDLTVYKRTEGLTLYNSEVLRRIWSNGNVIIGSVTFESAAYVAKYISKKITGAAAQDYYDGIEPEYSTMSRGGRKGKGLASGYFEKNKEQIMFYDEIILRGGLKLRPPKYYDSLYAQHHPEHMEEIKQQRTLKFNRKENSPARLSVKEGLQLARQKLFKRTKAS